MYYFSTIYFFLLNHSVSTTYPFNNSVFTTYPYIKSVATTLPFSIFRQVSTDKKKKDQKQHSKILPLVLKPFISSLLTAITILPLTSTLPFPHGSIVQHKTYPTPIVQGNGGTHLYQKYRGYRACENLELPYNLCRQIGNYYISSIYSLKISSMKSALAGV